MTESSPLSAGKLARRVDDSTLPPLVVKGGEASPPQYKVFVPQAPSTWLVVARMLAWSWAHMRFRVRVAADVLMARDSVKRRAAHGRRLLEGMGESAVKVTQQIAMRLDVLPLEYAVELAKLEDTAPAMEIDYVIERVEAAIGAPVADVFAKFDPEPIQSSFIACVYQAELQSGDKVAVKVRRPDASRLLNAERLAFGALLKMFRPIMPKRYDILEHVTDELPQLLFENLDFRRVARLQRLFRVEARKRKMKGVTAARVRMSLSSLDVIVSDFVPGVWLHEVIAAVESGNEQALKRLEAMGIDPTRVGKRILHACWWGFFENQFLLELPSPNHIIVQPKNKLVFIDIGDTGILGHRQRRLLRTAYERLCDHDVEGAAAIFVQLALPLPHIDVKEFTKRVEGAMWVQLFSMENKDSAWWERSTTGMWVAFLGVAQEYGVPLRLNISRMIQASCVYDNMAARVWPKIRVLKEFRRYTRRAQRREARFMVREFRKVRRRRSGGAAVVLGEVGRLARRLNLYAETIVEDVPLQFIALTKKGAYSASQLVRGVSVVAMMTAIATVLRMGVIFYRTRVFDPAAAGWWVVQHPAYLAALIVSFVLTLRRIAFRLDDMDRDSN